MIQILLTFRALTHAQHAARLLEENGCPAAVTRPPRELLKGNCGYGVRLRADCAEKARVLLSAGGVPYVKRYRVDFTDGGPRYDELM